MSIPQSFIQELLARIDVVDVVGRYVPLKKGGANFMGLCPFHGEKSPSFSVSPTKQFYHCFGCGKNGNAISFLMEHTGMGFIEAVNDLAGQVGMVVPQEDISPQERERQAAAKVKQATLNDVLERAGNAYRSQLKEHAHAVQYLKQRGVSGSISSKYGLGYAPPGWRNLASVFPEYDDPQLQESGLVIVGEDEDKRYDRFRDRIMFPIRDVKGMCIGFGGRVLGDEKPKYLNSPETPLFHKGRELYGLFEARDALRSMGYVLVTEGYMDVVALAQLGFPNAVATLGTACTNDHVQKLFRFTESVVFSFDGDSAGRRAAHKALEAALPHATDTRSIKFLFLPSEHDPDSFIREHGSDAFARHVANALPLNDFLIESASVECDLGQAQGRAKLSSQARPLWNLLPDGAFKRLVLGELADKIQIDTRELSELWTQAEAQEKRYQRGASKPAPSYDAAPPASSMPPDWVSEYAPSNHSAPYGERWQGNSSGRGEWKSDWKSDWKGKGKFGRKEQRPPMPGGPRVAPSTAPDQATRLLLSQMAFMERLDNDDLDTLVHQPAPHGPLFAWIESQFQENGPQAWAVLKERIASTEHAHFALQLMNGPHGHPEGEKEEQFQELRNILGPMMAERIGTLATEALKTYMANPSDTAAKVRYQSLIERRNRLLAAPTSSGN
ncbi:MULTISPECIES: DNA primase [Comamonas]|uniref:DNA primase n=1 Tax=Comamonas avium TaxID=2762231 RepID=A0ABR8SAK6_9BURK|nr:DNA primase [Comamonas avium]MBD7960493.1 DNA primase [Comamonas avium]MBD9401741.1 DNA primase [Comamonas sp. CMM02]